MNYEEKTNQQVVEKRCQEPFCIYWKSLGQEIKKLNMTQYYNPQRKTNLFNPKSKEPFKLSRSKIELFLNCPRCFYLDRRLGIGQPGGFPFNLNTAVDTLLKKEFDIHRAEDKTHPLMKRYGLDLVPFSHEKMNEWRENFKGIQYLHKKTNLLITGAVDDIWVDKKGTLYVVDYKATSKNEEITKLDQDWQISYKRQMEIYQWLLRQNGFKVSDTGYFVYCNGRTDAEAFDGRLEFDINLVEYEGNDSWVENAIIASHKCLKSAKMPKTGETCDFCAYREAVKKVEK